MKIMRLNEWLKLMSLFIFLFVSDFKTPIIIFLNICLKFYSRWLVVYWTHSLLNHVHVLFCRLFYFIIFLLMREGAVYGVCGEMDNG